MLESLTRFWSTPAVRGHSQWSRLAALLWPGITPCILVWLYGF